jgi:hypothetical protein
MKVTYPVLRISSLQILLVILRNVKPSQVVENLPRKGKALSSNHSIAQNFLRALREGISVMTAMYTHVIKCKNGKIK